MKPIDVYDAAPKPELGQYITLRMAYYIDNDSLLFTTEELPDKVMRVQLKEPEFEGDMMAAFKKMHESDSVHLSIPTNVFFPRILEISRPNDVSSKSNVIVRVRMVEIQTPQEVAIAMNKKREEARDTEPQKIADFVERTGYEGQKYKSGIMLEWVKRGGGDIAHPNNQVVVEYKGYTTSGTIFDESETPFQFKYGVGAVIRGWDEAIAVMHEGDKAILVVPSSQAYGARGVPGTEIGPFEPLVFEIELIQIIR